MQHTTYLNLNKPEIAVDRANIDVLNANMDILDTAVHDLEIGEADKQDKLTAGANIQINASNVISATDTTYSDFTGTDGTAAGTAGLVPAPAVTDTNKALFSDGTWKSVSTSAPVTDVEVDDISVVDPSGVAKIDLTGKQDTLTAGTNITIDANNVISATGNTDYTELTQAEYDELTPAEKENGTLYFITDADGDPQVVPNPQGTPTDTLNTIGIGNTIYDIAGSGGSSQTIADVLWSGSATPSTTGTDITLSHAISDYDFIVFTVNQSGNAYDSVVVIAVNELTVGKSYIETGYGGSQMDVFFDYTSDTTINIKSSASEYLTTYTKITGLKFCGTLAPMIYSTEEREVGVWVDDKPLYQKSYLLSTPIEITNNGASISSYIDNYQDIECFVRGQASYTENSYGKQGADIWVGYDSSTLKAYCSEGCVANVITLLYTKTADVAGSGSYSSLGVPMEHYDSTEKVVGTWFGDTLYEKSYDIDNPSNDATIISEDFSNKVITSISAIVTRSSDGAIIPLQFTTTNNWIRVYAGTAYNGIYFESTIAISNIKITIKYTESST